MKVPAAGAHSGSVSVASSRPLALVRQPAARDFVAVYRTYFPVCCRWLQAMGAVDGEVEDLAQEVFVVVQRKLEQAEVENLAGWIYRIARNTASDRRRRAFFRRLWQGRGELSENEAAPGPGPLEDLERRERASAVRALLDRLPLKLRSALVLFEVLGYSGEEIAALEGIPLATVWTRLHHARRKFVALAGAERAWSEDGDA